MQMHFKLKDDLMPHNGAIVVKIKNDTRVPSILVMEEKGNVHEYPMVREIAGFRVTNLDDAIAIAEIVLLPKGYTQERKGLCVL
jgi:hypothetical protein